MRRPAAAAALAAALAVTACSRSEQVPGVVVQVLSDLMVPSQLDTVELRVRIPTSAVDVVQQTFALDPAVPSHASLPLNFGLYPRDGTGGRISVTAIGKLAGDEIVWRSATLSFPTAGPTVLLPLPLLAACSGRRCGAGETCSAAVACRSDEVLVGDLTPYRRGAGGVIGSEPDAHVPGPRLDTGVVRDTAPAGRDAAADAAVDLVRDGPPDTALDLLLPPPPPDLGVDLPPACVARPEECFNSADDDCDQLIDCADPDCATNVAQCLAVDTIDNGTPGVSVGASAACPAGFNQANPLTLRTGPTGVACSGCSCGPAPVTCGAATIFTYSSTAACMADAGNTLGDPVMPPTLTAAEGCKTPNYVSAVGGLIYGMRVAPMAATMGGCTPSGMATPGALTWASTVKFCPTVMRGGGCPQGQVCVPRPPSAMPAPRVCVSYTGARACPTGTTRLQNADWYTGATDGRTCGPCTCGAPTGGSCAPLYVHVGNDYTCNPNTADVGAGKKVCFGTSYSPGLQLHGTPAAGSCTPASNTAGAVMPTGRRTVCCP